MRPTIGEQLGGTCRVLEEVVAPEVVGTPAAETLRGLVRNLRLLESSWSAVLPFLRWDSAETAALLRAAAPALPPALARRVTGTLAAAEPDPVDAAGAEDRNDVLRGLLSEAVAVLDPAGAPYRAIVAHLAVRTGRYPMRMIPDLPRPEN